jgi:hypothetical protein
LADKWDGAGENVRVSGFAADLLFILDFNMLSNLRYQLAHLQADNIFDVVVSLRVWQLSVDSLLANLKQYGVLDASMAQLALANLSLRLETDAIASLALTVWPPNMSDRLDWISSDLKKSEDAMTKMTALLNNLGDQRSHILGVTIKRMLS